MLKVIARHEADLQTPSVLDRTRFLAALATVESSGGRNWQPNFEAGFWEGGLYWNVALAAYRDRWRKAADPEMAEWCGKAIACSWGPWQLLYVTAAELGYEGPPWGLSDADVCLKWVVALINKRLVPRLQAPLTDLGAVGMLADGYNSGTFLDTHVPFAYVQKVRAAYLDPGTLSRLSSLE